MGSESRHRGNTRFDVLVGTGGIGWGRFFAMSGNATLGREESRMGRLLDRRDYCKLHIISHYVKALAGDGLRVVPIGMVGDDEAGRRLIEEMRLAGVEVSHVGITADSPTLYSFCLIYPDGSGGNLTTEGSASAAVNASVVGAAEPYFALAARRGIALAAPEVPLEARLELLELATRHGAFRAASFVAGELSLAREEGMLRIVDLLSINSGEAAALCGRKEDDEPSDLARSAWNELCRHNPSAIMSMTAGARGSWTCDERGVYHQAAWKVPVAAAAGAGDAFFGGMIAGLSAGLTPGESQELASLTAAASVMCPHTINEQVSRPMLAALLRQVGGSVSTAVSRYLEDGA